MAHEEDESAPLLEENDEEHPQISTRKITRRVTVEPILVLYFMVYAPSVPLYEQYVYQQISERHNFSSVKNDSSVCVIDTNSSEYIKEQLVQAESSHWLIYFSIASIVPATFVMALIGPYTDETGRKLAMYLPIIGSIGKLTVSLLVIGLKLPLELIMVGCVLDGLSGSIVAITMTCFAYIADVSSIEKRALRIFMLEIAIGLGIILSNIAFGYAIKLLGYFYPFVILLSLNVLNFIYTYFAVEESIIKREHVPFFTTVHMAKIWTLFAKDDDTQRKWKLQVVLLAALLVCAVDLGNSDIQTYKLLKSPLCFTSVLVGYFTAVNYTIKVCFGTVFLKLTFRRLREVWIIILSCISATAFNLVFPFATTEAFVFSSLLVNCVASLSIPMMRSYTSKLVSPREQGTMMALIAWIQSAAALAGGATLNSIYSATLSFYGGLPAFLTAAGAYTTAGILTVILLIGTKREAARRLGLDVVVNSHD